MSMPQITSAFAGWMNKITLLKITEKIVEGFVQVNKTPIKFQGTIQPLSARSIELKPEGQRSFTWLQIHCISRTAPLIPGDKIVWSGNIYKVTDQKDYSLNGYIEYHACKDFQQGGAQ